ncbi:MAG: NAD(P)/FAD-dependent oxidoreductase [Pseudomonadota bacterium]
MIQHFDSIVIGAGPGGSTLATLLARKGMKIALIEQDHFPRFKIGESLLPHSMDVLKESGVFEKIDSGKYIRKYGATFMDFREDEPIHFEFANGLDDQHSFAFEVPREEFDKDLLDHAIESGVSCFQPCKVISVDLSTTPCRLVTSEGDFTCDYVVDATGRSALLGNELKVRIKNEHFINNVAVFNHYSGVKRDLQQSEGDIILGILPENSWSWHIPFKGDVTSVGVVCSNETLKKHKTSVDPIREMLDCHPHFQRVMREAKPLRDQQVASNYSYSSGEKIGKNFILVGDAATFLDPVFSSGVHISLTSAHLAAQVISQAFEEKTDLNLTTMGQTYAADLQKGVDRFQSLLLLFYKTAFIQHMKKVIKMDHIYRSFTSAFSGDMWNDSNCLFRMGVLKDGKLPDENYLI